MCFRTRPDGEQSPEVQQASLIQVILGEPRLGGGLYREDNPFAKFRYFFLDSVVVVVVVVVVVADRVAPSSQSARDTEQPTVAVCRSRTHARPSSTNTRREQSGLSACFFLPRSCSQKARGILLWPFIFRVVHPASNKSLAVGP